MLHPPQGKLLRIEGCHLLHVSVPPHQQVDKPHKGPVTVTWAGETCLNDESFTRHTTTNTAVANIFIFQLLFCELLFTMVNNTNEMVSSSCFMYIVNVTRGITWFIHTYSLHYSHSWFTLNFKKVQCHITQRVHYPGDRSGAQITRHNGAPSRWHNGAPPRWHNECTTQMTQWVLHPDNTMSAPPRWHNECSIQMTQWVLHPDDTMSAPPRWHNGAPPRWHNGAPPRWHNECSTQITQWVLHPDDTMSAPSRWHNEWSTQMTQWVLHPDDTMSAPNTSALTRCPN